MFIPKSIIPDNDITIIPKNLYKIIIELIDSEIEDDSFEKINEKILNKIRKILIKRFKSTYFWNTLVLSEKVCEHVYGEYSKKFGNICGARIDIKYDGKNYKCSQHIGIKHTPKNRVPEEKRCKGITKYNNPCKKEGNIEGYCKYHIKDIKIENENKLLNIKKNCNISGKIIKRSIYLDSLYNIIEKLKKKSEFIEKQEIVNKNIEQIYIQKSLTNETKESEESVLKNKPLEKIKKNNCCNYEQITFTNINILILKNIYRKYIKNKQQNTNTNLSALVLILFFTITITKMNQHDFLIFLILNK